MIGSSTSLCVQPAAYFRGCKPSPGGAGSKYQVDRKYYRLVGRSILTGSCTQRHATGRETFYSSRSRTQFRRTADSPDGRPKRRVVTTNRRRIERYKTVFIFRADIFIFSPADGTSTSCFIASKRFTGLYIYFYTIPFHRTHRVMGLFPPTTDS